MWTRVQGQEFLAQVQPKLKRIGWIGKLVGGVARRGYSQKDLDILLQPVGRTARNFLVIDTLVRDMFPQAESTDLGNAVAQSYGCENETWVVDLPSGQVVEFFIRLDP